MRLSNEERLKHNPKTPGKEKGDHAGHIFGDRFGGSPELDNLVSQASDVNLSKLKKIENLWAKEIKAGKKVEARIDVKYDLDNLRPAEFIIRWRIDGEEFFQKILNK